MTHLFKMFQKQQSIQFIQPLNGPQLPSLPAAPAESSTLQSTMTPADTISVHLVAISYCPPDDTDDIEVLLQSNTLSSTTDDIRFATSRAVELNSLVEQGVFSIVPSAHANGHRLFGAHFVDLFKKERTAHAFEKSRLVIQAFNDKQHGMLTHALTVQRPSMRLLLCLCAMDDDLECFTRDVSQAYMQSGTTVQRTIFVRPPSVLALPIETLLRVEKSLHGLPEAGVYWFQTYHSHHKDILSLKPSSLDTCFLYTPKRFSNDFNTRGVSRGFTCLQTNDTTNASNYFFIKKKATAS